MKILNRISICTLTLLFALAFTKNLSHRVIRKCCKENEMLSKYLNCTKIKGNANNNDSIDLYGWLPESNIKAELEKSVIMYDTKPSCPMESMDVLQNSISSSLGNEYDEFQFHIRDNDIRLDVIKGSSYHDPVISRNDSLPSDTFCMDRGPRNNHIVMVCPCSLTTCVRTCCADGFIFNKTQSTCVFFGEEILNDKDFYDWIPKENNFKDYYRLEGRLPQCEKMTHQVITTLSNDSRLLLAGDGSIKLLDTGEKFPRNDYCGIYDESNQEMIIFCLHTNTEHAMKSMIYGILFIIGAICLLATVIVAAILPEMRRNINGKMALAHNFMLFIGYLVTGIAQLAGKYMSAASCAALSLLMQFSILAAFFWLNVMCIDISWTFSGLRPIQGTALQRDRKKFIYYSVYAWGTTALISIITITVEYSSATSSHIKPNFGVRQVFFNNRTAELVFFFGPMALLLIANLILFAFTTYKIVTVTKETSILNARDSSTSTKNKQTLILYVKLFSLMGVTWLTEVISWAVGGPSYQWYFTDAINLLRAVFIFVIFCCKRTVFNKLHDKVLILLGKKVLVRDTSHGTRSFHSNSSYTRATTVSSPGTKRKCSASSSMNRKLSNLSQDSRTVDFDLQDLPTKI